MATVYATSVTLPAQARTVRTASTWSPQSGQMYTRPWRSSPLAGPAFSTLPPIISESSEESHEDDLDPPEFGHTQPSPSSSSIVSDSRPASASGYTSRNASGSTSALMLVEGAASTSSISLHASSSAHGTGTSSHGHGNSQSHSHRSAHLTKSPGRRPSSAQAKVENVSETSITPPPRARTVSHGHSRSASFPSHPVVPSPTIPQVYSRASPRPTSPESESNVSKQPPSTSRDPSSNWMSSSPFGPGMTPKFSRLAMASPAVIMPLSAREYRKRKARESVGNGKEMEPPAASNHVTFTDNPPSVYQTPNGVPLVKVSPPPLDSGVPRPHPTPSSSGDPSPDRRTQPQPQADHPPPRPLPHASMSAQSQSQLQPQPSSPSPRRKRPRSRPNTPPRSSPLAAHPPISPKSSAGTFFSFASASSSDDDTTTPPPPPSHPHGTDDPNATIAVPPVRPRPRPRRRKSYPDRLSNGARLSLLEAMNRLSQESASLHRLSTLSQTDGANRLSVTSQASGHTLFYDADSDGEVHVVSTDQARDRNGGGGGQQRTSVLHTQSLEDLSSTLARTGIEVVHPDNDGDLGTALNDERKGRRNVRTVRISDTVEVSPPPVPRRRKLTKSRPGPVRGSAPGPVPGTGTGIALGSVKETRVQPQTGTQTQTQTPERRGSLLPWKSKGSSSDTKSGAIGARSGTASAGAGEKRGEGPSTPTKALVHPNETTTPASVPHTPTSIVNGSIRVESPAKPNSPTKKPSSDSPASTSTSSTTPRKAHRYTFSFLSSPTFHRSKREKSHTLPAGADLGSDRHVNTTGKPRESSVKGVESGTDSTSTSIRTITQGSQSTLTPASPLHYDLTTPASSGRGTSSSAVPMLRRVNAQAMATVGVPAQSEWDGGGDSTPSLITNGSTATSSSVPRTFTLSSFVRIPGGEPFVPQPSGLKESFTDTSEEDDMEGVHGREGRERTPRVCMHRRQDQRPSARAGGAETFEDDERARLHARSSSGLSVSMGLSPSPRPDTPSSTLTTATETSGSYVSFSTLPASTTSSSTSPSLIMSDKRGSVPLGGTRGGGGDGDGHVCTCTMCGQFVPRLTSPSPSPTRDLDQAEMHPMFTVPLVTVPASAVSAVGTSPRGRDAEMGMGSDVRYMGRRKTGSERHLSVPVPAAVGVGIGPARSDQCHDDMHPHVIPKEVCVPASVGAGAGASSSTSTMRTISERKTKMMTATTTTTMSPLPPKARKHRRPQTAPAGTGDATSKFIEDAMAMRARDGSVDGHVSLGVGVGVGGDRATKHKGGGSKFKAVLKGLLRWHG